MRLALGHVAARAIHALAHFRIADHLAAGLHTPSDLARATGTHEPSLLRLLRAATVLRLVVEHEQQHFSLTPYGEALRSDAPRHAASAALAMGEVGMWRALGEFAHSVETGEPLLARFGGTQPFADAMAAGSARTAEAMIAFYGDEPGAVAEAYDFANVAVLADLGGSSGNLLTTILARNPKLRGILYDLPHTATAARAKIEQRGVADRCEVIGGNFFESVPTGAEVYVLSHVLHDWPEEKCDGILRNVGSVIPKGGRLLVVEPLLTTGSEADAAKFLDIIALAITGGRHRTLDDHRALLARNGFRLTRVIETSAAVSILESEPA